MSLAICHDEDGWCQIPINSFLLEVKAEGVLVSSLFYALLPPISFWWKHQVHYIETGC